MLNQNSDTITFRSANPLRILNRGPEYFRNQLCRGPPALSAVEQLEADKVKYVKSSKLVGARQEPVRPGRPVYRSPRKPAGAGGSCRAETTAPNLEVLRTLIRGCDLPSPTKKGPYPCGQSVGTGLEHQQGSNNLEAGASVQVYRGVVRRVDVRPSVCRRFRRWPTLSPAKLQLSPMEDCPELTPQTKVPVYRSDSELLDQNCQAQAELEKFFNYCGLEPEDLDSPVMEQLAQPSSDNLSLKLQSVSACSSQHSNTAGEWSGKAISKGVSIIERNARIIKWLYNCREARGMQVQLPV
ncbi:protein FAM110B-like [Rhincodon typus]|uniref:protein FAM110B-like n=1 Tax=Rhincodon typus TaxID=259920 RepID=UPI002030ABB4|nr:protein FAM110B-like [Rhincodon typus]